MRRRVRIELGWRRQCYQRQGCQQILNHHGPNQCSPYFFVVSVRKNFGVCAVFLGIQPELNRFVCPKLDENQTKKRSSASFGAVFQPEKFIICLIFVILLTTTIYLLYNMSVRSKFMGARSL